VALRGLAVGALLLAAGMLGGAGGRDGKHERSRRPVAEVGSGTESRPYAI